MKGLLLVLGQTDQMNLMVVHIMLQIRERKVSDNKNRSLMFII